MTDTKLWTINEIKDHMRAAGSHWFDPDTMRFFKGRVLDEVYQGPGGIYFVSSERHNDDPRKYTVREFVADTSDIKTAGEFNVMTKAKAIAQAKRLAQVDGASASEPFKPVSVVEQFVHDLRAHGTTATVADAKRLMAKAKLHHRYCELLCSDEHFCADCNEDGEHPAMVRLEKIIGQIIKRIGCAGVIFSGDPRGCTVKLTFADGHTNDFGKEGYCVPINE